MGQDDEGIGECMPYLSMKFMRSEVCKMYPGDRWREKVRKMADGQVMAIYYKFLNNGVEGKKDEEKKIEVVSEHNEQLTFDDILSEVM